MKPNPAQERGNQFLGVNVAGFYGSKGSLSILTRQLTS